MKGGGNLIIGAAFYIDGGGGRPPQLYGRSATDTTSASFIKKRAPYERKQLFYPIKRISGIVASAVGLSPRMVGVLATPLYLVVT